jgi:hypothetical protein
MAENSAAELKKWSIKGVENSAIWRSKLGKFSYIKDEISSSSVIALLSMHAIEKQL